MAANDTTKNKKTLYRKFIKKCFAPSCSSNSMEHPNKHFFKLPDGVEIRKEWALAVGRTGEKTILKHNTYIYCCEDHFNVSFLTTILQLVESTPVTKSNDLARHFSSRS